MSPDDPRHGTSAGYIAGCRDQCCWLAKQRYDKRRRLEFHTTGRYRKVSNRGAIRRIQALQAIGWSVPEIAKRCSINHRHLYSLARHPMIYTSTFEAIARAFDEMAMTLPLERTTGERISSARARNHAARNGWAPPLAWDDIDNDPRPNGQRRTRADYDSHELVDEATVLRVLSGENLPTNRAERIEIMRRWLAMGRSERSLCVRLGWQDGRYTTSEQEDVA